MTTTDWLSPSEAGALLGVGPDRIAQLARDGTLTSMRTPGNHVRVRRDEVEQLLKDGEDPPQPVTRQPGNRGTDSIPDVSPPPPRPKWEEVPPWQRRVREAEADVHVLELDDQRQRLMESREQRQAERDRAESRRASQAAENERLQELREFGLSTLPFLVPDEVKASVARELGTAVTSASYPPGLARSHAEVLLKGEVERLLRPWRAREARRAQAVKDSATRESLIAWTKLHVTGRVPREWDWDTRQDFERELVRVLQDEVDPDMTQDEVNRIGMEFLDEWLDDGDDYDDS